MHHLDNYVCPNLSCPKLSWTLDMAMKITILLEFYMKLALWDDNCAWSRVGESKKMYTAHSTWYYYYHVMKRCNFKGKRQELTSYRLWDIKYWSWLQVTWIGSWWCPSIGYQSDLIWFVKHILLKRAKKVLSSLYMISLSLCFWKKLFQGTSARSYKLWSMRHQILILFTWFMVRTFF